MEIRGEHFFLIYSPNISNLSHHKKQKQKRMGIAALGSMSEGRAAPETSFHASQSAQNTLSTSAQWGYWQ